MDEIPEWLEIVLKDSGLKPPGSKLRYMFSNIMFHVENEDFDALDNVFKSLKPEDIHTQLMGAFLRAVYFTRERIPNWFVFRDLCRDEIVKRGEDVDVRLVGLY
jgi:hypothetical protein